MILTNKNSGILKKLVATFCLLLMCVTATSAQEFIGCRTSDGWVETPMLRKTFHVDYGELRPSDFQTVNFQVSVASLGYHEVYVNDIKVGDKVMQPAVSQLDRRCELRYHAISPRVRE